MGQTNSIQMTPSRLHVLVFLLLTICIMATPVVNYSSVATASLGISKPAQSITPRSLFDFFYKLRSETRPNGYMNNFDTNFCRQVGANEDADKFASAGVDDFIRTKVCSFFMGKLLKEAPIEEEIQNGYMQSERCFDSQFQGKRIIWVITLMGYQRRPRADDDESNRDLMEYHIDFETCVSQFIQLQRQCDWREGFTKYGQSGRFDQHLQLSPGARWRTVEYTQYLPDAYPDSIIPTGFKCKSNGHSEAPTRAEFEESLRQAEEIRLELGH
ncbi:hypothetical protein BJ508DRAFT_77046 [Ascobolus immersus RN42]|uniref:Uncharacterized protein n=1 Tax=Ascobolus immersus RN42 TaxID=1160509 RepID=A0A3N4HRE3_ASCIM|nr:hypothetical protein BJ508DRAFT_77046 [Ascobolus immersus RN42]